MEQITNDYTITTGIGVSTMASEEQVDTQRAVFTITNMNASGGDNIFLATGNEAAANKGLPIFPQQTIIMSIDGIYMPTNKRINLFAAGASICSIHEELYVRGDI